MPGALVTAKIEKILSDGLSLSFLSFFTGTVDQFHLAEVRFADRAQSGSVICSHREL